MVDQDEYRHALGRFATGVTVVTFAAGDADHGITVNSFASLSLDPPLVLWNCDVEADSHELLPEAGHYAVNVLAEDQEWLSARFAGEHREMVDPFEDVDVRRGETGAPLIEGTLAYVDCTLEETYPGGDHSIFVGRVEDLGVGDEDADPLLFYEGGYRAID
jgi:flavin reductase (DIM6/NTAB) family NADH-FMN oxidoreductase RutF